MYSANISAMHGPMNVKSLHVVEGRDAEDFKLPTKPDMFKNNKDINSYLNEARYNRSRVDW